MDKIRIPAIVLSQKDKQLYLFKMKSSLLGKISYVTPRSEDNPAELQRVVNIPRAKEIGKWLKEESSLLPNAVVIDLKKDVQIEDTGIPGQVAIPDPDKHDDCKIAYILDGQHRVRGFDYSDGIEFDLAVVAVHNMSESVRAKLFIDINSKQIKVDERLLLDLMAGTRILESDDERIYEVIKGLDSEPSSALHGKIQFLPEQKNKWLKNTAIMSLLKPHLGNGGCIYTKTTAQKIEIMNAYFNAVREVFPNEWNDQKNHVLTKSVGFEILLGIFGCIKNRCDLYEGKALNKISFTNQIAFLKDKSVLLRLKDKSTISIDLNWTSNSMGQFSNKQWIREIIKELLNMLNQ
ncbi:MAG: DGQHR domain-containing protein [Desulfobacterales bacterium]|nr:DGQHR domain-containing protein [Desulfobacterales bacterium]